MVELLVQGGSIELHESETFNKLRHRLNKAKKMVIDYENGNIDGVTKANKDNGTDSEVFEPFHVLTFRTADDGRVSVDPQKIIGVVSDTPKDVGGGDD